MFVGEPLIVDRFGDVEVWFSGREGAPGAAGRPSPPACAWVRQVHGRELLEAQAPGLQGDADALVTRRPGVALAIQTADCVPILLAGDGFVAAVHAGWRGVAGGIVEHAVRSVGPLGRVWIGPAIGPCCYEVGPEVAEVFRGDGVLTPGREDRSQLDLAGAVRRRLPASVEVVDVGVCTRCDERWWSYRRSCAEGVRAGRNVALIWFGDET
jgi:YfiH family protein